MAWRPGLTRYVNATVRGQAGVVITVPRFAGIDYASALALAPEGIDRALYVRCLKRAEAGLFEAAAADSEAPHAE